MEDRIYRIGPDACWLGHQYEHNKTRILFEGYTPVDETNAIYLKFNGRKPYLIPMLDLALEVTQPLTEHPGVYECQIEERSADDTLISQSCKFNMFITKSLKAGAKYEVKDDRLETIYRHYNELYQRLVVLDEKFTQVDSVLLLGSANPVENDTITKEFGKDRTRLTAVEDRATVLEVRANTAETDIDNAEEDIDQLQSDYTVMRGDVDYCKKQIETFDPEGIVIVDEELSNTSTHPVENRVVTAALDGKEELDWRLRNNISCNLVRTADIVNGGKNCAYFVMTGTTIDKTHDSPNYRILKYGVLVNRSGTVNGEAITYSNVARWLTLENKSKYPNDVIGVVNTTKTNNVAFTGYKISVSVDNPSVNIAVIGFMVIQNKETEEEFEVYSNSYYCQVNDGQVFPLDGVRTSDLATVATSGSYNDLDDKPTIPSAYDDTEVRGLIDGKVGFEDYATSDKGGVFRTNNNLAVTTDGRVYVSSRSYVKYTADSDNSFISKGTLENVLAERLDGMVVDDDLATVATSGSYNDLTDKPTIGEIDDASGSSISLPAGINTGLTFGCSLELSAGTYLLIGNWHFNSRSGTYNRRVGLYNSAQWAVSKPENRVELAIHKETQSGGNVADLQVVHVLALSEADTITLAAASSVAGSGDYCSLYAMRIGG